MPTLANKTGFNRMLKMFEVDAGMRVRNNLNGLSEPITGAISQSGMSSMDISPGKAKYKNLSSKSTTVISTPHFCYRLHACKIFYFKTAYYFQIAAQF